MNWRVAKSLEKMRAQVNALYPKRSKASDGTIGDPSHQSRKSDHNAHIKDGGMGVVSACDITHDPKGGFDAGLFAGLLIASRDPRVEYIIWNRQIAAGSDGPSAWKWRKYSGINPHNHHVHISVKEKKSFYDDDRAWAMPGAAAPAVPSAPQPPALPDTVLMGSTGETVKKLQRLLGLSDVDGMFGLKTRNAVIAFQKKNKIGADGKVGSYTWAALLAASAKG